MNRFDILDFDGLDHWCKSIVLGLLLKLIDSICFSKVFVFQNVLNYNL